MKASQRVSESASQRVSESASRRISGMLLVALLLVLWPVGARADAPIREPVSYAETTDTLILRFTDAEPGSRARVELMIPWAQTTRFLHAQERGGVWTASYALADLPVMTEIRYAWIISSPTGEITRTETVSLARPDPVSRVRQWQHGAGEYVDVYAAPGVSLAPLVTAADAGYLRAAALLGAAAREHTSRPRVVVVGSQWDYAMLTDSPGQGVAFPRWGVTLQHLGGYPDVATFGGSVVAHELLHLLDPTAARYDVPAWFTEGLAVMAEDAASHAEMRAVLAQARREGLFYHEWNMAEVDACGGDMRVWYAQAWSMVEHLGIEQARAIILEMERGRGFLPAWRAVVGEPPAAWYAGYLRRVGRVWLPYALAGLAAVLVAVVLLGRFSVANQALVDGK
jgi:hypothetical protein